MMDYHIHSDFSFDSKQTIKQICESAKKKGLDAVVTMEPGGTAVGEKIRDALLSRKYSGMDYKTEALLFLASRG